ncbi:hypothetical protein NDU88_000832 [Pleurodeles waltl]|uniref:Uncharacterized protein n=1 Tax=Pleurodeles waltl TaxID=8319 RepID=A0AAV7U8P4_PLEWA|nr:hypothetical protein NDU88_000832 [Pleurodeles waltl]
MVTGPGDSPTQPSLLKAVVTVGCGAPSVCGERCRQRPDIEALGLHKANGSPVGGKTVRTGAQKVTGGRTLVILAFYSNHERVPSVQALDRDSFVQEELQCLRFSFS